MLKAKVPGLKTQLLAKLIFLLVCKTNTKEQQRVKYIGNTFLFDIFLD